MELRFPAPSLDGACPISPLAAPVVRRPFGVGEVDADRARALALHAAALLPEGPATRGAPAP